MNRKSCTSLIADIWITRNLIGFSMMAFSLIALEEKLRRSYTRTFYGSPRQHRILRRYDRHRKYEEANRECISSRWNHRFSRQGHPHYYINFNDGNLQIVQTLRHNTTELQSHTKTASGTRSIAIDEFTLRALKRHRKQINEEKLSAGSLYKNNDLVVCTTIGTPMFARNVLRTFYNLIKKADVKKIRFHDLRHTHATLLLQQGVMYRNDWGTPTFASPWILTATSCQTCRRMLSMNLAVYYSAKKKLATMTP